MNDNDRKKLNLVLENFDFKKVEDAMVDLDWEWCGVGYPKSDQIKDEASRLLEEAYGCGCVAAGGLVARYDDGFFSLEFVLEDCNSFELEENPEENDNTKIAKETNHHKSPILSLNLEE